MTTSSHGLKSVGIVGRKRRTDWGNVVGQKFGRLTVLEVLDGRGKRKVRVRCDCGVVKVVLYNSLQTGLTTSCGCFHRKVASANHMKHGGHGTTEYKSYSGQLTRKTQLSKTTVVVGLQLLLNGDATSGDSAKMLV